MKEIIPIVTYSNDDFLEFINSYQPPERRYSKEQYLNLYHTIAIIHGLGTAHKFNLLHNIKNPDSTKELISICFSKLHYYIHVKSIYPTSCCDFVRYRFIDEIDAYSIIEGVNEVLDDKTLSPLILNLVDICAPLTKFYTLMYFNLTEINDRCFYARHNVENCILAFLNSDFNFNDNFNNEELLKLLAYLVKNDLDSPLANSQAFTNNIIKIKNYNNMDLRIDNIRSNIHQLVFKLDSPSFAKILQDKNNFFNSLFILDYEYCKENNLGVYKKSLEELKNDFTSYGGTLNFSRHSSWRKDTEIYQSILNLIYMYLISFDEGDYINSYLEIKWIRNYIVEYQSKYGYHDRFCVL